MKTFYTIIVGLLLTTNIISQQNIDGELKSYMYHIVMKSPILKENIGRYFEYSGPLIKMNNGEVNYDSIDVLISNKPDYLFIRTSEIAKCSPGIVAELANKTAIWELNKTMMAHLSGDQAELLRYQKYFDHFETLMIEHLPEIMLNTGPNGILMDNKMKGVLNPSVSFNLKKDLLLAMRNLSLGVSQQILESINLAVIKWVEERTYQIFSMLGAKTNRFDNILIAAGDGSFTSGLLGEKERDSRGRFYRGLPRAIGFFPYQMKITKNKTGQDELRSEHFAEIDLISSGNGLITIIHPDIWGYNGKKQTTLVIEKSGRQYLLFGSGETRFLSPDSTFSEGGTFMSVINELEHKYIANLKEKIYGKQGFDYWIAFNESEIEKTKKEILNIELDLKKYKSSASRNSKSGKKKIQTQQDQFIKKQNYYDKCELEIKQLTEEKSNALEKLDYLEAKLSRYKRLIGTSWITWTMTDGVFTFEDGATFDIKTQDFRFTPTSEPENFEIRLLAIPMSATIESVDEVMAHISISAVSADFDKTFNMSKVDWFSSNSFELNSPIFSKDDSVVVHDILNAVSQKMNFKFYAKGLGIGRLENDQLVHDDVAIEITSYPGETNDARQISSESEVFRSLRRTAISIHLKEHLEINVLSSTDPVRTNFNPESPYLKKLILQGKITQNEALSTYRTAAVLRALKQELMYYAGEYYDREKAALIIDYLENEFKKLEIFVKDYSIKLIDLS